MKYILKGLFTSLIFIFYHFFYTIWHFSISDMSWKEIWSTVGKSEYNGDDYY